MHVSLPLVKPDTIEARAYQVNIARSCLENSTLVVLPTGLGKTIIAAMVIAETLHRKGGKALFLAPTKPLVEQHARTLEALLTVAPITSFTGEVAPAARSEVWAGSRVVVSTPQVVLNDLISGTCGLDDVRLLIYDEAHRGVGNYAYVFIAEKFRKVDGLALGITASPGSTAEKILEVCGNLDMKRVEIRREHDPDVSPYVHDIRVHWLPVMLPPDMVRVLGLLKGAYRRQVKVLQEFGLLRKGERHSVRELLDAQKTIRQRMAQASPRPPASLFHAAAVQAAAVALNHAVELAETQGTAALTGYLDREQEKAEGRGASRSARMVMADEDVMKARYLARHLTSEHPKLDRVKRVVGGQLRLHPRSRIIVFTHYRDTSDLVVGELARVPGCRPVRFVGQASRGEDQGLSQKEQAELISKFKEGVHNVLVATSVGEEGLDIPSTDLVIFYEPVPSEIRTIQRRGRTGRKMAGKVVILVTQGTRDEVYRWTSSAKERRMMEELDVLRKQLAAKIEVGFPSTEGLEAFARPGNGEPPGGPAGNGLPDGAVPAPVREEDAGQDGTEAGNAPSRPSDMGPRPSPPPPPGPARDEGPPAEGQASPAGERPGPESAGPAEEKGVPVKGGGSPGRERTTPRGTGPPAGGAADEAPDEPPAGLDGKKRGQLSLGDFSSTEADPPLTIIVDHREFGSGVVRELSRLEVRVVPRQLGVADFVVSDRVGVERKEVRDLVSSILDGRLFTQLKSLRNAYLRPLIIIEGEDPFSAGGLGREAVQGAIASMISDFGVPVVLTRDDRETAGLLRALARREVSEGRTPAVRGDKGVMSLEDRQQFIAEGLPNISGTLSQRLLAHFGSVQRLFNATEEELREVRGVGEKTAGEIVRTLKAPYLASKGEGAGGQAGSEAREEEEE